ncbi:MAG TPA: peptidase M24 [Firmicutes bacterium]|nr:peptidase M24 [Bacillota bacterium]
MDTEKNLKALQEELVRKNIKAYYITPSDEHNSEYVPSKYLQERLAFCPFTGNDGTLLVTQDNAYLFTDGRYFIQAEKELKGSSVNLIKLNTAGYPSLEELIYSKDLFPFATNFKRISAEQAKNIIPDNPAMLVNADFSYLVDIKEEKHNSLLWGLGPDLSALTRDEKVNFIRDIFKKLKAHSYLITDLTDIAYVLNLRGNDIPCTPVFYSFLYIDDNSIHLFIDFEKYDIDKKRRPDLMGIDIHPYNEIYDFFNNKQDTVVLYDPRFVNYELSRKILRSITGPNVTRLYKSVKRGIEIKNIQDIHVLDGVAMVKFIKYVYEHKNDGLTECELAKQLEQFRLEEDRCFDLSFESIVAVDANAAEMHYSPTESNCSKIDKNSTVLLVDSGGQYYGGTTDITRTFILKKPSDELRYDYTLTLKAVINLSDTIFMEGCTGQNIDIKAREIMWREGMDYKCGTGHGVGYMLSVHEGPNSFRYAQSPNGDKSAILVEGMVTTIEPGVYKANKYGIRIENELNCVNYNRSETDLFLTFECVTCCPIETKYLDLDLLTDSEIEYLNGYHDWVLSRLTPYFTGDDLEFLKKLCAHVKR